MLIQQGDVLFHAETIPSGDLKPIQSPIVQHGEATGHAHRLYGGEYEFVTHIKNKTRHLRVVTPVMLRHEEHKPIEIPPGEYRIGIVREYDHLEEEAREVRD